MERTDKIMTQEEYNDIQAEITLLEMEASLTGKNHDERIAELKAKIE